MGYSLNRYLCLRAIGITKWELPRPAATPLIPLAPLKGGSGGNLPDTKNETYRTNTTNMTNKTNKTMKTTRLYTLVALLLLVPDPPFERGNRLVLISFLRRRGGSAKRQ